jgi:hypothetical protein
LEVSVLKNITLSAEDALIERARQRAEEENTTLNAEFRRWLAQYANRPQRAADYLRMMAQLSYSHPDKTFNREELNER